MTVHMYICTYLKMNIFRGTCHIIEPLLEYNSLFLCCVSGLMSLNSLRATKTIRDMMENDEVVDALSTMISLVTSRTMHVEQSRILQQETSDETEKIKGLWRMLSPSMYALMFCRFIDAMSAEIYVISYPVIFESEFGINSTVGGYLNAAANVFSYLVLSLIIRYSDRTALFQYPYHIMMVVTICIIGNMSYVVFYAEWIAYSLHWIMRRFHIVVSGLAMVSRLYLVPPDAFNRITSIVGMLKTGGYLIGSAVGPILCTVSFKLPFLVMAVMNTVAVLVVGIVFYFRRKYLSSLDLGDDTKGNYLMMERAYYEKK